MTLVTPLASHTLNVAGSRAWLRATSLAYGITALKSATSGRVYKFPDWKKCTWPSIMPGISQRPLPSMRVASAGTRVAAAGPRATMRSPRINTVASGIAACAASFSGCTTVTPMIASVRVPPPAGGALAQEQRLSAISKNGSKRFMA